jgi:hypothetical protein
MKKKKGSGSMLTTNISQIVSSIIDPVPFKRKDQKLRIFEYILGIFLPKHVNESRIASEIMTSQSTMSRALSRSPLTEILSARIAFLKDFINSVRQEPKYLILDETVIKRYGTKSIEFVGKYYSSIEQRVVNGIELLTSVLWINSKLYFPVFTTMANPSETSTEQFSRMIDSVPFEGLIVLTDGGITSSEIISKSLSKGYTVIGRIRTNITVVVDGVEVLLSKLNKNTRSVSSVIAWVPAYSRKVKLVFDNTLESRVIISTDLSMDEYVILGHYSKREHIEDYFNYVKNELGLGAPVYLANSMLMHAEAVQICFTVWMVSQFLLNVKDQIGLRDFVEKMRISYYFTLFKLGLIPLDMDWHAYEFLKLKCIL